MSPFKSRSQMKAAFGGYLGKEMKSKARKWAKETPNIKKLPEHKKNMPGMSEHFVINCSQALRRKAVDYPK